MFFCRVDLNSVQNLVLCVYSFSQVSGVVANSSKSSIYIVGASDQLSQEIANTTHFSLGKLPFRYLGVPLSSKRLSPADSEVLVDKMTHTIKLDSFHTQRGYSL